jgi:hypothetical protein
MCREFRRDVLLSRTEALTTMDGFSSDGRRNSWGDGIRAVCLDGLSALLVVPCTVAIRRLKRLKSPNFARTVYEGSQGLCICSLSVCLAAASHVPGTSPPAAEELKFFEDCVSGHGMIGCPLLEVAGDRLRYAEPSSTTSTQRISRDGLFR